MCERSGVLRLPRSWSQRTPNQVLCLEVFGFSAVSGWGTNCPSQGRSIFFLGWADRKKAHNLLPAAPSRQSFWPSTSEFLLKEEDFPGGIVDKNSPANAGDTGLIPDPGRFHMPSWNEACRPELLSPCSRAHKPLLLSPRTWSLCSTTGEAAAVRSVSATAREKPPLSATRESPSTAMKTQPNEK